MSTDTNTTAETTAEQASESSDDAGGCTAKSGDGSSKQQSVDEKIGSTVDDFDADPGQLTAVGLGPGHPEGMTQRARAALLDAEHIVGYTTYIELLPEEITEEADELYDTPMCGEVSRTEEAIDRALAGNDVAIIGSGDPNVYALSGLALEIIESKGATASMVDYEVVPGVPAAQSCSALLGAPLVNDTVSISLSDHLVPMPEIESRSIRPPARASPSCSTTRGAANAATTSRSAVRSCSPTAIRTRRSASSTARAETTRRS
jgi:precorrin-3 methyltransferase (EC 2.1.1.131)